ncbi:hypothetical protein IJT93_06780 [bacterium]|nr:hypothetical protein [bacterium]
MSNAFTLADRALNIIRNSPFMNPEDVLTVCNLADQAAEKAVSCREFIQAGMVYLELGKAEKACETMLKAVEKDKKNPAALLFASLAENDAQKYEEALKHLDELKTLSPGNQAAPTLRALICLNGGRSEEALNILEPKKGKFDLTVSPQILSRLAEAAEKYILPRELPEIEDDFAVELRVPEKSQAAKDLEKINPLLVSKKNAQKSADGSPSSDESALNSEAERENESGADSGFQEADEAENKTKTVSAADGETAETEKQPETASPESDESIPSGSGKTDSEAPAASQSKNGKSDKGSRLFSILDTEAASLASKGSKRLRKCWDLPEKERLRQLELALKDLRKAYEKNRCLPQLAYDLGEAILGSVEYGHKTGAPLNAEELAALEEAEGAFDEAINENSENAYALHYAGRVALLKRQPVKAEQAWRLALTYFEKLPESEYGLAQVFVLLGDRFQAHRHLCRALMSDLQLLRDRLKELKVYIRGPEEPAETDSENTQAPASV